MPTNTSRLLNALVARRSLLAIVLLEMGCASAPRPAYHWQNNTDCDEAVAWCVRPLSDQTDLSQIVCVDFTGELPQRVTNSGTATDDSMLDPNRNVVLRVVRRKPLDEKNKESITVTIGGSAGETAIRPSVNALTLAALSTPTSSVGEKQQCLTYEAHAAPRTPGVVPIALETTVTSQDQKKTTKHTIRSTKKTSASATEAVDEDVMETVAEPSSATTTSKHVIELLVPQVYSGALRVGLSMIWGAADHSYSVEKMGDGGVATVVDHGPARWNTELVAGYAPFWQAFTRKRGRDSFRLWKPWSINRFSPYFGLGIASAATSNTGTQLRWLRSFYVGFEYEVFATCSIALTYVARRTDTKVDGIIVGEPVAAGTNVTTTHLDSGVALIFSFSPEFFQFASSVGGSK